MDGRFGSISGSAKDQDDDPLEGVTIELIAPNGTTVDETVTASDGTYTFTDVVPGDYTIKETNPPGYDTDISDEDTSDDGDAGDTDSAVDNEIPVTVHNSVKSTSSCWLTLKTYENATLKFNMPQYPKSLNISLHLTFAISPRGDNQ